MARNMSDRPSEEVELLHKAKVVPTPLHNFDRVSACRQDSRSMSRGSQGEDQHTKLVCMRRFMSVSMFGSLGLILVLAVWLVVARATGRRGEVGQAVVLDSTCHDAVQGESCFYFVEWARSIGFAKHPEEYAPLTKDSSFHDFQAALHYRTSTGCPRPCTMSPSSAHAAKGIVSKSSSTTSVSTTHAAHEQQSSVTPSNRNHHIVASEDDQKRCHDAVVGEKCFESVAWAMREGIQAHPEWYPGMDFTARFEEFQMQLHQKEPDGHCQKPCKHVDVANRRKGIPGATLDLPGPTSKRRKVSFYMYRAQRDDLHYPLENVNTADLAGVMWYLHNEIVPSHAQHRKYNISRLYRFKVDLITTWEYYNVHKSNFGPFLAFDKGQCTVPDSDKYWNHYGGIVGCQFQDAKIAAYHASSRTVPGNDCKDLDCHKAVWYSLPGPCPGLPFPEKKTAACKQQFQGGLCDTPTGKKECTYSFEEAGSISLDELSGIGNIKSFFYTGGREYVFHRDAGIGCTFWDGKRDPKKCSDRMEKVKELFKKHYPDLPGCDELDTPVCDSGAEYKGEFSWPTYDYNVVDKDAADVVLA